MSADRCDGARLIVQLNWPFYAVAAAVVVAWPVFAYAWGGAGALVVAGWILWSATAWWAAASIAASYWVYDRSAVLAWTWLETLVPAAPRRWINLHAGLDQSTPALKTLFPGAAGATFDIFDGSRMTEPAIRRARQRFVRDAIPATHASLPVPDGSVDVVFLLFAAHELRARSSREELFREVARVLAPGGRLVLVEHPRDTMNAAAFGPGAWHFLPRAEWLRLFRHGELAVDREVRFTRFVRAWTASKGSSRA